MLRHKYLFKKTVRYNTWKPTIYSARVKKSFLKNYKIFYKNRYSLLWHHLHFNKDQTFYISQNKLQCFLHYSFSVPSKKVQTSRFFLNKSLDTLMYGGYQKR